MTLKEQAQRITQQEAQELAEKIKNETASREEQVLFLMLTLKLDEADARNVLARELGEIGDDPAKIED
ncbi:MAG: hypothetical protein PHI35_00680 [Victivallaceae bacterium]|nr:hypothetical protein [Victivallaceae bacterium]